MNTSSTFNLTLILNDGQMLSSTGHSSWDSAVRQMKDWSRHYGATITAVAMTSTMARNDKLVSFNATHYSAAEVAEIASK